MTKHHTNDQTAPDGLAEIIRTRLLGVHPDDQDVQLEDADWRTILSALTARDNTALLRRARGYVEAVDAKHPDKIWADELLAEIDQALEARK